MISFLLVGAVVGLPILIKDDGTAQGFAQILITYTLGSVAGLLGLCTLWLACGTLARDVEECQIQMVAVKPIARWQIWLGKWLGLVTLNAALLGVAGACIFGLLEYRAQKLPPALKAKLQNEVLVARSSAKENSLEKLIDSETDRLLTERSKKGRLEGVDLNSARAQLRAQVKAAYEIVGPDRLRGWVIHLGKAKGRTQGQAFISMLGEIQHRAKQYRSTQTYLGSWLVGAPKKTLLYQSEAMSLSQDTFSRISDPAAPV